MSLDEAGVLLGVFPFLLPLLELSLSFLSLEGVCFFPTGKVAEASLSLTLSPSDCFLVFVEESLDEDLHLPSTKSKIKN